MKTSRFVLAAATVFLVAAPLATFASVFQVSQTVAIPKEQLEAENLYLAGKQVIISTTAQKDLVAAGGSIVVNGPVYGNALLVGGTVSVLNDVKGSVRAAGGVVSVSGMVGGDVVVAGGTVTILPGSVVTGDVIVGGGTIDIEGVVNGQVHVYGGDVKINGLVAGPVIATAGKSLTFGERTVLGNTLSYKAPAQATVLPGAKLGSKISYIPSNAHEKDLQTGFAAALLAILGILILVKFAATLLSALILQYAFPRLSRMLSEDFVNSFWKMALTGFAVLVITPIACILLALTAIGIYIAFFVGLMYLLALVAAGISMCVTTGALLSRWIVKEIRVDWKWTVLGTVAVFVFSFIPFLGWAVDALLFFAAMGTVITDMRRDIKAKR